MKLFLSGVSVLSAVMIAGSAAQQATTGTTTTGTATTQSVADNSPTENLVTVAERGPGTVIDAARARHLRLRENRLAYQHGQDSSTGSTAGSGTGTTTNTGTTDLSDTLSGLINGGGLGSLAGLLGSGNLDLGSLLGGGATGSTGTGSTGTSTTGSNIPSNITPEVIAMLQGAGFNIDELFPASGTQKAADRAQSLESSANSILMDRWPGKVDAISQTTTEDRSFGERWKTEMALTFFRTVFTAINAGLSQPAFIQNIADVLQPILRPDLTQSDPAE